MNLKPALLALPVLLAALGATGCVDPKAGDTTNTPLYVYDDANKRILVWDDLNAIYDAGPDGAAPAPSRTITSTYLTSLGTLAWGGMTFNSSTNQLYLVSTTGKVVRIENASSQNADLTQTADIVSFTLGNPNTPADRLSSSVFGQAALDASSGNLYTIELGSNNQCRVWVIATPGQIGNNQTAPSGTYLQDTTTNDIGSFGVAAGGGNVFVHYIDGGGIDDGMGGTQYTGPRLRMGAGSSLSPKPTLLIGASTLLGDSGTTYASLGYDSTLSRLYLFRPASAGPKVLAYTLGQFNSNIFNQSPYATMADDDASLASLRFVSHAGTKDWLVGADQIDDSTGTNVLRIWKAPSMKGAAQRNTLGAGVKVRGLAMDGSR